MYSVDDIKSCIQEWFAEACNCVEVAQTYSEILKETERQLKRTCDECKNKGMDLCKSIG